MPWRRRGMRMPGVMTVELSLVPLQLPDFKSSPLLSQVLLNETLTTH